ncbi:excinuclease ABC subunit UvrA [bacterium]|nr:excinuclease ABC subunit UvrA [bacterium]
MSSQDFIIVQGAREHNLKNIDVKIPRNKLVVITGLSGSGKSSLAFDTIYAEGQRRYVESLSSYARQFLGLMEKPDVDYISGLSPAISIQQKSVSRNPRSTVATVTEIYDYLRLLFARVGIPHCYNCGKKIQKQSAEQIVNTILEFPQNTKIQILSPLVSGRKGEYKELFTETKKDGYTRVRVDGEIKELSEEIKLAKTKKHTIEVLVDRLVVKDGIRSRLTDSIETALKLGKGITLVDVVGQSETLFSEHFACHDCQISYEEIAPRNFSFNSPFGACSDCDGIGFRFEIDEKLIIPDASLSINQGAVAPLGIPRKGWYFEQLRTLKKVFDFSFNTPFNELNEKIREIILYGSKGEKIKFAFESKDGKSKYEYQGHFEGIITNLNRRYKESASAAAKTSIERWMSNSTCKTCNGARLKKETLAVKIANENIASVASMSISNAYNFFENLKLTEREQEIATQILKEIKERTGFLLSVGLDYLSLDRTANTLSGGESQRIHLATQIGSQLVGVLYVLDEPSIGLHQRDNERLIKTLLKLRDLGNTVIVVEHDKDTMEISDFILDLGPGAGRNGGSIVGAGTPEELKKNKNSITGQYLSGEKKIEVPQKRRVGNGNFLEIKNCSGNNLKNIDFKFPLGTFVCVTGVSGSGKSTLINETLFPILAKHFYDSSLQPLAHEKISGLENLDKVIDIDQSPIGRTPRSNPATYTGLFSPLRDLFTTTTEAKIRGYQAGRFSFNVKGGRCENCEGAGLIKIEMHFLPDVYVPCEVCKGKRYNSETLEVRFKGKNISEVLEMTVEEALEIFINVPSVKRKLQTLYDVGLGYIHLGQQATTLSGGEAQRVKLATELSKIGTGKTLYILDEPTTGLHFDDVKMLLKVLEKLVEKGNTVLVIEHNLDVIKTADFIVDLGPEGGNNGGKILVTGTPEEVVKSKESYTAKFLKEELKS